MEQSEVAKARQAIHGLVQRGARKQQRELYSLRAAEEPRKLQADQSVYEQLQEEGWGRAPAAVPVGFAAGMREDSHDDDDGGGIGDGTKRKRPGNKCAHEERDEDEDENQEEDDDRSTLSKAGSNAGIRGQRLGNLTTWELNHFRRRHFLLPQGAWPILPSVSPAPLPPPAESLQEEGGFCRPPLEALPDDLAIDGVRHFVPRVRVSGGARKRKNKRAFEPAKTLLEWLPFENVIEPRRKEMDGYPVPSPVLARVLDAALVRQLVGVVQAPRKEEDDEEEDEDEDEEELGGEEGGREKKKKPVEVRLYDLLQSALGRLGEEDEGDEEDEDDDDEEKQKQQSRLQERAKALKILRQCLGREVERMVDGLLGHVLAYWSERSQAQRSEEGYLAWLRRQRACHTRDPKKGRSLEDRMGFANQGLVLGDWHDVLGAVEERVAVDAAAAKGRREERRRVEEGMHKKAKKQVKEKVKYARSGVKMIREHDRKVRERLDEAEDVEEEEEEEGREEEGEVNVLRSALDARTLSRSRARLERLFWAGKGALPPEGGL
jgi:hypothetical protein